MTVSFIGGGNRRNHWPAARHWQTLSHNVVSSTPHRGCFEFLQLHSVDFCELQYTVHVRVLCSLFALWKNISYHWKRFRMLMNTRKTRSNGFLQFFYTIKLRILRRKRKQIFFSFSYIFTNFMISFSFVDRLLVWWKNYLQLNLYGNWPEKYGTQVHVDYQNTWQCLFYAHTTIHN